MNYFLCRSFPSHWGVLKSVKQKKGLKPEYQLKKIVRRFLVFYCYIHLRIRFNHVDGRNS